MPLAHRAAALRWRSAVSGCHGLHPATCRLAGPITASSSRSPPWKGEISRFARIVRHAIGDPHFSRPKPRNGHSTPRVPSSALIRAWPCSPDRISETSLVTGPSLPQAGPLGVMSDSRIARGARDPAIADGRPLSLFR